MGEMSLNRNKARSLRKNPTEAEKALWRFLRLRQMDGHKFRRQFPIGRYIVDFISFEKRIIIEVDGGHHAAQVEYDQERTAWLESQGFQVFRFWNQQVMKEIESVKEVIMEALRSAPPPQSSPVEGEEAYVPSPSMGEGQDGGALK